MESYFCLYQNVICPYPGISGSCFGAGYKAEGMCEYIHSAFLMDRLHREYYRKRYIFHLIIVKK